MTFIIPHFRDIFDNFGGRLPAFTRGFLSFYDMVVYNLHYIAGAALLLLILGVIMHTKTRRGHYVSSKIALRWPLLGKIFKQAFIATFCKTMSTLIEAGVPVLDVFDILAAMTRNDIVKSAIIRTKEYIVEGSSVSLSLAASEFFPDMVVNMVRVGEESGSMSKVLDRTAGYYERKVDSAITTLLVLLEPIMILTVGAIVLVVVVALYLPIFTMSDMTR
jgi:type IV pilus assembly protein PilC